MVFWSAMLKVKFLLKYIVALYGSAFQRRTMLGRWKTINVAHNIKVINSISYFVKQCQLFLSNGFHGYFILAVIVPDIVDFIPSGISNILAISVFFNILATQKIRVFLTLLWLRALCISACHVLSIRPSSIASAILVARPPRRTCCMNVIEYTLER